MDINFAYDFSKSVSHFVINISEVSRYKRILEFRGEVTSNVIYSEKSIGEVRSM